MAEVRCDSFKRQQAHRHTWVSSRWLMLMVPHLELAGSSTAALMR